MIDFTENESVDWTRDVIRPHRRRSARRGLVARVLERLGRRRVAA
ncbi:hypothetical protein [Nocardioides marmorisolisilvae]|nr:hypothetical protein [Nocardioides marmorisolisilvae]